jgi:hypothetical protein
VKDQMKYYKHYEKLMQIKFDHSIVKTPEYQIFSEIFPHISESIRLKREIERLTNKLESEKTRSVKIKIKKEIIITKIKLRKNNLFKRLHGETRQETNFYRKYKINTLKTRVFSLAEKYYTTLEQAITNFRKKLKGFMIRNLPPTIFNLRELDASERGLALREWNQKNRTKTR